MEREISREGQRFICTWDSERGTVEKTSAVPGPELFTQLPVWYLAASCCEQQPSLWSTTPNTVNSIVSCHDLQLDSCWSSIPLRERTGHPPSSDRLYLDCCTRPRHLALLRALERTCASDFCATRLVAVAAMASDTTPSVPLGSSTMPADLTNAAHLDATLASANAASPSVTANDLNDGSAPSSAHGDVDKVPDHANGAHAPPAAPSSVDPSPLEQNGALHSVPTATPVLSTTVVPQPTEAPFPTDPPAPTTQSTPQLTISTQDATMTDASEPQTFTYHPLKTRSRVSVRFDGQEPKNGVVLEVTATINEPSRPIQGRISDKQSEIAGPQTHYSYYIHLDQSDHRMDRWVDAEQVFPPVPVLQPTPPRAPSPSTSSSAQHPADASITALGKRKRAEVRCFFVRTD